MGRLGLLGRSFKEGFWNRCIVLRIVLQIVLQIALRIVLQIVFLSHLIIFFLKELSFEIVIIIIHMIIWISIRKLFFLAIRKTFAYSGFCEYLVIIYIYIWYSKVEFIYSAILFDVAKISFAYSGFCKYLGQTNILKMTSGILRENLYSTQQFCWI